MIDIIEDIARLVPTDQKPAVERFIDMIEHPSRALVEIIVVIDHLDEPAPTLLSDDALVVDSVRIELPHATATWDGERMTLDDGESTLVLVADAAISDVHVGEYGLAIRQEY